MDPAILWVVLAGLTEPLWVASLKRYNSSGNLLWGLPVLFFMIFDPFCLSWATAGDIPVSVAYSVWVSIGTVTTTATGILLFKDAPDRKKILYIFIILVGVVGLQFTGGV